MWSRFLPCAGLITVFCRPAPAQQTPAPAQVAEAITVIASRSTAGVGETAKTVYQLGPEALHAYPAVTLDEALRQHSGFELFRRSSSRVQNPTSAGVTLRGLGSTAASRTLVLEDGAPLNDPFGGWVHWNENPAPAVEAVTLVSGGGSDLYGSSALGGVIDLTPTGTRPEAVEFSAAGGSQNTEDFTGLLAGSAKQAAGLVAGEVLRTGGYVQVNPASAGLVDVRSNDHSEAFRVEAGRRLVADPRVFLTANVLNEARGNGTPVQTNATRLWRYLAGYDLPENSHGSGGRLRVFGADEGYRQSFSAIALPRRNAESLSRLQRVRTQEFGATGDASARWKGLALVGGADLRDIRGLDDETPITKGSPSGLQSVTARQRFVGGFAEVLGTRGKWSAAASLRADGASNLDVVQQNRVGTGVTTLTATANRTETIFSPRVGVVRDFGGAWAFHAGGFRAFRAPTMNELYRTGQVGQETTLANAALRSERATGWEAGAETLKLKRAGVLKATYFWTEINRPVSAVLVSQTATPITNKRENLGQIQSQGVEAEWEVANSRPISASFGYEFARATVTKFAGQPVLVGKWIPEVPRQSATAQLRGTSGKLGALTLAARFGGKAYDDSSNLFPLNSFFELDVSGQRSFGRHAEVFFVAENLTDVRQQVARTPVLTLGSPIFAEAGLRWRTGAGARP